MEIPQQSDPFEEVNLEGGSADNEHPSVLVRKMVGMMFLKNIYNLSDEGVVVRCLKDPFMQYFTGEKVFQKCPTMNPIDNDEVPDADRIPRSGEGGALD